jgi:hypothetical protein
MKINLIFLNLILIFAFCRQASGVNLQENINPKLLSAINKLEPKAKILKKEDIDTKFSCEEVKVPGIVKADFNGDGFMDYAVLLKIGDAQNTVYNYEGKKYPWKKLRVWLVVFMGYGKGDFYSIILEQIEDHSYPAIVVIKLQPPGIIRNIDSDRSIELKHQSILEYFCGKSSSVYYWDKNENNFIEVYTSE